MSNFTLNRRTVLRGMLAGTAVSFGLPPLEAMFNANGTAYAAGGPLPRRLGVFFLGQRREARPLEPDGHWGRREMPNLETAPFTPIKEYVSIVSGMSVKTGKRAGDTTRVPSASSRLPDGEAAANGAPFRSTYSAPTIDQVGGGASSARTRSSSRSRSHFEGPDRNEGTTLQYLSPHRTGLADHGRVRPGRGLQPHLRNGLHPPSQTPIVDVTLALRKSVLDAVLADITGLPRAAQRSRQDPHRLARRQRARDREPHRERQHHATAACTPPDESPRRSPARAAERRWKTSPRR